MALLRVSDLRLYYATVGGVLPAVDEVSLIMEGGEALGVVGESGAGKSSLALALMRTLPRNIALYDGIIEFEGVDCSKLSDEEFRKRIRWQRIAMVFQGAMDSLNPVMRVGHQVAEPLLLQPGVSREQAYAAVQRQLELLLLPPEVFQRYPHELSGGMRQRIMIAMALILSPKLVILDEPTSALDVIIQAQIMNVLKRLKGELGLSILFITHDLALASDLCDAIAVMYAGEIIEQGGVEEVLTEPGHPYTQKLLATVPRLKSEAIPEFIPGAPPDMTHLPQGCRFHPRCPHAFERCRRERPLPFRPNPRHQVRCWLWRGRP
ncbi:MAG TPA: ABC transporter ATP-binding protein [Dehalococcoidia bacterium]|nr:ABC transporter ATP-binding protein [Dehalococcoidia bacterium]